MFGGKSDHRHRIDSVMETAIDLARKGHNVIITGQAGTGKTWVIKTIIRTLKGPDYKKVVAVTASTGIAAQLLSSHGGNNSSQLGFHEG